MLELLFQMIALGASAAVGYLFAAFRLKQTGENTMTAAVRGMPSILVRAFGGGGPGKTPPR